MDLINPGLDTWRGELALVENARYQYGIIAWVDAYASHEDELAKKRAAGQDVRLELEEASALMPGERRDPVAYDKVLEVVVDRARARFAAWYEMFPRSQGTIPGRSASFADATRRLAEIAELGFDVVYLTPIHPIGRVNRKGPNNALSAGANDPGSVYAIGAREGGHTAIHPELGTIEDFARFRKEAERLGMEVALDLALQCAPDHPWVGEHKEWFRFRPDGSIRYAENPPKKYQDIVNVDFESAAWQSIWHAWRDVVEFWIAHGVKIFRVDNPHTKPLPFWQWLIAEVQSKYPEVVFLSEAFTRPPMLHALAKAGFSQSYTYFTWRNTKEELTEYLTELTQTPGREYLRPNLFVNTPDILHAFLQTGGRPAFRIRLALAATLSSLYGIYSGFELCENRAIPGTEEYVDSEKYQYKVWDWDRPGHIKDDIRTINRIRRENPALHEFENLAFHAASDPNVLFYGKEADGNSIFVAVNLDPFAAHETQLTFPFTREMVVEELFSGQTLNWSGEMHHWRFDPEVNPAAIFRVRR
jgi:starch synthase (maltosyl-transferring)